MKLSGSYKLKAKKEIVWKALNNPNILKQCIPGCDSFEKESDNIFNVTATNQIGPMHASVSGTVSLSNIIENQSYTMTGEGQSSVGFANGSANVKLDEDDGSTILTYEVNIDVGGKIAQLGSRLISGVAKKMSDYFFGRFADVTSPIKKTEDAGKVIEEKRVIKLESNFLNKYIYSIIFVLILLTVAIIYFVSR